VETPQRAFLLMEKLLSVKSFLLVTGTVLFVDTYLLAFYGMSIFSIESKWNEVSISVNETIKFIFAYSVFYGGLVPLISVIIDNVWLLRKAPPLQKPDNDFIRLDVLKDNSLEEHDNLFYNHYLNIKKQLEDASLSKKLSLAIVLLVILNLGLVLFGDSADSNGLAHNFWTFFGLKGFMIVVPKALFALVLIGIFLNAMRPTMKEFTQEYIPKYEQRLSKDWIDEVKCGLLSKDELLHHLKNISADIYNDVNFDSSNKSHKYCITHDLARLNADGLKLTAKGHFFEKY
jgi:hypothetical protein